MTADAPDTPWQRAERFQQAQPPELLEEALQLPGRIARMNARPVVRLTPVLELADRFSALAAPYVACTSGCNHCCHGHVAVTGVEAQWMAQRIGVTPVRLTQYKQRRPDSFGPHTPCTFLVEGRCSIYAHRPFACRVLSSFELTGDPCKLTKDDGTPNREGQVTRTNLPHLVAALNEVVAVVGRTDYADIRDLFPHGLARTAP